MAINQTVPGFPDATNTGVPEGVILKPSGDIVVTKAGTVLSGLDIKGNVFVDAPDVTVENCRITSGSWQGIKGSYEASGLVVQNCEIDGQGKVAGSYGIIGTGKFTGNDIHGFENGIGVSGSDAVVKGNYIHDLQAPGSPHYDGIALHGGQDNVLIEGNTVIGTGTSDVFIKNDFGPISNITVNHNYLAGNPGYNMYVDGRANGGPITDVSITDNYVDKGNYGFFAVQNSSPTMSGNVEFDSESGPIPAPPQVNPAPAPQPTPAPSPDPIPDPDTTPGTTPDPDVNPDPSPLHNVVGKAGQDWLHGGADGDRITGNLGNDALFGGGGNDIFDFNKVGDSPVGFGQRDLIHDFEQGMDKIDLSGIDAVKGSRGNQDFDFLGNGSFQAGSSAAGQLKYHYESTANGDRTLIEGNVDGDPGAEFQISLIGRIALTDDDFLL